MAFSKASSFEESLYRKSFYSKAMAHPARILIITYLLEYGTTRFDILARKIPLAKTTTSQHVRQLREAGIIQATEKFPHTYYTAEEKVCGILAEQITRLGRSLTKHFEDQLYKATGEVKNG